jgi:site-specific recombinase XerD
MKKQFELQTITYQLLLQGYDKLITAVGYKQKGRQYQDAIREFLHYLEKNEIRKINNLKAMDMVSYYEYLTTRPKLRGEGVLSDSSINGHLFSIELFFNHLLEEGVLTKTISLPRHTRKQTDRNILSTEQIQTLYAACENKRDRAILSIAYGCGPRRTEIENLEVADVQLSRGILIVRKGKNGKRRDIPMSNAIIADLKDYLLNERHLYFKDKQTERTESFLVNNKGKKMKGDHINERLKELVSKTNITSITNKGITLHSLRACIATHLLDNSASMEFVRTFLGHSEIDTVHIYSRRRKMKQQLTKQMEEQFA